jgi:PAS domain S-box-containing protein
MKTGEKSSTFSSPAQPKIDQGTHTDIATRDAKLLCCLDQARNLTYVGDLCPRFSSNPSGGAAQSDGRHRAGSEKSFRSIVDNAQEAMIVFQDGVQGVRYANRRASELTGYSPFELSRIQTERLLDKSDLDRIKSLLPNENEASPPPQRYETMLARKDGDVLPVEFFLSQTRWEQEAAVLIILRDVSLRKRIESELGNIRRDLQDKVRERTRELTETKEKLEAKQLELMRHKKDLERANRELVQTNTALSVLARNIDKKRDDYEKQIAQAITSKIVPLIEEIMQEKIPERSRTKLEVLSAYLNDLTPAGSKSRDVIISLSSMELRVAMMIKNGFKTEEIGRLLNISFHTVKTHRKNIRRKLRLSNSSINLTSYLKFKLGKVSGDG